MARATLRGRFVWHELLTTDPKAAISFYTRLIGWKTKAWEKDPSYTVLQADSGPVGGVMLLPPEAKAMGAPSHWLPYIATPDVNATVETAVRRGAKVLKPVAPIPDAGLFAVVADPSGATFAPFTPQTPMELNEPPHQGEFSWHELATTDQAKALEFYQELFGWEKTEAMDMGPAGVYQMFGFAGKSMGGIYNRAKDAKLPLGWLSYTVVPDSKRVASVVPEAGGKVITEPMEVPGGGIIATFFDPQGATFAVHSIAAATAKAQEPAAAGRR